MRALEADGGDDRALVRIGADRLDAGQAAQGRLAAIGGDDEIRLKAAAVRHRDPAASHGLAQAVDGCIMDGYDDAPRAAGHSGGEGGQQSLVGTNPGGGLAGVGGVFVVKKDRADTCFKARIGDVDLSHRLCQWCEAGPDPKRVEETDRGSRQRPGARVGGVRCSFDRGHSGAGRGRQGRLRHRLRANAPERAPSPAPSARRRR